MIARDALLEWAIYDENHYGTPSDPVAAETAAGRDVLLDIEIEGARQVRAQRPDALMIFVSPPSTEVLRQRLRSRGDTSSRDIASRLKIAESQLEEAPGLFDHIVVNEDLEHAIDDVADLIIGS